MGFLILLSDILLSCLNAWKTSLKDFRGGVYAKCVLWRNQIVFNGLRLGSLGAMHKHD